jgi:hypothetical protein
LPTIPSVPATFTCPGVGTAVAVTFAIPAGVYTSGYWQVSIVPVKADMDILTLPSGSDVMFPVPDTLNIQLTPQQLTDANAEAGGSLSGQVSNGGSGSMVQVTALTLTLNGTPATRRRADIYVY